MSSKVGGIAYYQRNRTKLALRSGFLKDLVRALNFRTAQGSIRHGHMRELRVQIHGDPYRILYAFDPPRVAILLLGGDKTGDDRWYEVNVPEAERLYDLHLSTLERETGREKGST